MWKYMDSADGVTVKIHKNQRDLCNKICKEWEDKTKLTLEYAEYSLMAVMNVSTYLAVYTDGSIKQKSDFEVDKELYKNPSMRIVPIALEKYYVNNIPVEETIMNHDDIYDFCMMVKCNRNYQLKYETIEDNKHVVKDASRIQRYYASTKGGILLKEDVNSDSARFGKRNNVNVKQYVTLFNKYVELPMNEYNIDYQYYIKECYKIINNINPKDKQLTLF